MPETVKVINVITQLHQHLVEKWLIKIRVTKFVLCYTDSCTCVNPKCEFAHYYLAFCQQKLI